MVILSVSRPIAITIRSTHGVWKCLANSWRNIYIVYPGSVLDKVWINSYDWTKQDKSNFKTIDRKFYVVLGIVVCVGKVILSIRCSLSCSSTSFLSSQIIKSRSSNISVHQCWILQRDLGETTKYGSGPKRNRKPVRCIIQNRGRYI